MLRIPIKGKGRPKPRKDGTPTTIERIKGLGDDFMSRLDAKLLEGIGGNVLARWVQEDLQQLKDIGFETLKKTIERYRTNDLRPRTLNRIAQANSHQPTATVFARLNALDELEEMVRYQKERVERLRFKEADLPKGVVLTAASNEIKLLNQMTVDLARLQLETGLLPRASRTLKGVIADAGGLVKTFQWTEEQEALFQTLGAVDEHAAEDV